MKRQLSLALLLCTGCVGGFDDRPFLPGEGAVVGQLPLPVDPAKAYVAIGLERGLSVTSSVAADGSFRLERVPRGKHRLVAATGVGRAGIVEVEVYSGRSIPVTVPLVEAAAIEGRVVLEEMFDDHAPSAIAIAELPRAVHSDGAGRFALSELPPGCLTLRVEHAGFLVHTASVCPEAGEVALRNARLRHASPHAAAICAPCSEAAQCHGGLCLDSGGERYCSQFCDGTTLCPAGFVCDGSACRLPHQSCTAVSDFKAHLACTAAEDCGLPGEDDALCDPLGSCTLVCSDDHQCPSGAHCVSDGSRKICR